MLTGNTSPAFHVAPSQYNMMDSLINTESEEFYDSNVVQGIKGEPTMTDCKFAELTSPALSFTGSKKLPSTQEGDLLSWVAKHPKNWMANEVLDWLYYVAGKLEVDFTVFRGESFQAVTGEEICRMSQVEFQRLLPEYGKKFYDVFQEVLAQSHFDKPTIFNEDSCDDSFLSSDYSVPGIQANQNLDFASLNRIHSASRESVEVINGFQYDIDLTAFDCAQPICPEEAYPMCMNDWQDSEQENGDSVFYEPGYGSLGAGTSSSLPQIQQVPATPHASGTMLRPTKPHAMMHPNKQRASRSPFTSCCSDEGSDFEYERPKKTGNRGRKPGQTKGNHLWEFIRDLLKNNQYCGKLIKWEDRREGVFRFVQSEAVAQMWGRKKNNAGMTYEKLSRAMRFSRTAGYFADVPKNGKFPKKLCFKFGHKSFGWQETDSY